MSAKMQLKIGIKAKMQKFYWTKKILNILQGGVPSKMDGNHRLDDLLR